MFCTKCGSELSINAKFCNKCGNRVGEYPVIINAEPEEGLATKLKLIQSLQISLPIYAKIDEFSRRDSSYRSARLPVPVVLILVFGGLFWWFMLFGNPYAHLPGGVSELLFLLVVIAPSVVIAIMIRVINNKKAEQNKAEADLFLKQNYCQELFVLPQEYRYFIAVDYIYRCLTDGRADSLKEALNLYVEQRDRWVNQRMTQQVVAIQRQQSAYLRFIAISNILR